MAPIGIFGRGKWDCARVCSKLRGLVGPLSRNVLSGLARAGEDFDRIFDRMLERGELKKYGSKRGTEYGQPGRRRGRLFKGAA